ncbi:hypothetical protein LO749_17190 [Paracoccus denitrificans]|uniref:dCTP deaminase domain-containing protein n=1 Tax=Paracoccus denitrificans TaxID=266 RepID=UPI001E57D6AE|nr:hypothetical protein [Paracoccus denitrificans]UFS66260.1 hypothetical protein LO749_17190 [Paracoccus denitrificans]
MIFVITGVRGSGKTTLIDSLRERGEKILKPSTSRPKRFEGEDEYYFVEDWAENQFAWVIEVGNYKYGYTKEELLKAGDGKAAFMVFDPLTLDVLRNYSKTSSIEMILVGLDTIATLEEQESRVGGDQKRRMTQEDLDRGISATRSSDLVIRGNASTLLRAILAAKSLLTGRGGILAGEHLFSLLNAGALISHNFDESGVQSASYDLTVGDQVWCGGKLIPLSDQIPTFTIPPYSYAIVTSKEEAWLPTFVAGSFDIKVGLFLRGVVLSNGPQIDPGYRGPLFCMLFNGSSDSRTIARGDHFSTLQFSTATSKCAPYSSKYQLQGKLEKIMSEGGLSGQGGNIVRDFNDKYGATNSRLDSLSYWLFGALTAAMVAFLGISVTQLYFAWNENSKIRDQSLSVQDLLIKQEAILSLERDRLNRAYDRQLAETEDHNAALSQAIANFQNEIQQLRRELDAVHENTTPSSE